MEANIPIPAGHGTSYYCNTCTGLQSSSIFIMINHTYAYVQRDTRP